MISGQQLKQILDFSLTNGTGFIAPSCGLIATPASYLDTGLPASIALTDTIIPNDGVLISWTITDPSNVAIATGLTVAVSHSVTGGNIPTVIGSYIYTLTITYTNSGNTYYIVCPVTVVVSAEASYGQNIVSPVPGVSLTTTDQVGIINPFTIIIATGDVSNIVIIVPDAYGTVSDIEDQNDASVIAEFNAVNAAGFTTYTRINTSTEGTYQYKVIFA
jgi:hypothetical protein